MDNPVWIAVIVAAGTLLGPLILAYITGRQRHREAVRDYARQDAVADRLAKRQDAVAAQAAEAARLLSARQDDAAEKAATAARLLLAANERVAEQSKHASDVVNGKLAQIHDLVNSTLTAAMTSELIALEQQLQMMAEVGRPADRIREVQERVAELRAKLEDRARQTAIADAQVAGRP